MDNRYRKPSIWHFNCYLSIISSIFFLMFLPRVPQKTSKGEINVIFGVPAEEETQPSNNFWHSMPIFLRQSLASGRQGRHCVFLLFLPGVPWTTTEGDSSSFCQICFIGDPKCTKRAVSKHPVVLKETDSICLSIFTFYRLSN